MIVLVDRYPQNQSHAAEDAPQLGRWRNSSSELLRFLSRREEAPHAWADTNPPDLIIYLDVSPEVAASRDEEHDFEEIAGHKQALESVQFNTKTVRINADQDIDEVGRDVRAAIWKKIRTGGSPSSHPPGET